MKTRYLIGSAVAAAAFWACAALSVLAQPARLIGRSGDAVQIYIEPNVNAHSHYAGRVGDQVEVLRAIEGEANGNTWFNVEFSSGVRGWIPAEAIQFVADARPSAPETTIAQFQTNTYSVRVFRQDNRVRMNVFNKTNNRLALERVPVRPIRLIGSQDRYSGVSGDFIYTASVSPGNECVLQIEHSGDIVAQEAGECK